MRILQTLYVFVLRAKVLTTFGSKVVIFSARNTEIYKICKLRTATFSAIYKASEVYISEKVTYSIICCTVFLFSHCLQYMQLSTLFLRGNIYL